jgi:hypothetical protein
VKVRAVSDGHVVALQSVSPVRTEVATADTMTAVGNSVFVRTDDGRVVRLNAAGAVTKEVEVDTAQDHSVYCQGIGTDGRSVYVCSATDHGTDVVRVDPATLRVSARYRVHKLFDQLALPFASGRMWVLSGAGDHLLGIDVHGGATADVALGVRCTNAAPVGRHVVLACTTANQVLLVDPAARAVLRRTAAHEPRVIAADGRTILVGVADGVLQLDRDLVPHVRFTGLYPGLEGDLLVRGDTAWVRTREGFLHHLDLAAGRVTGRVQAVPPLSGGSLLEGDGALWTTAYDDDVVIRLGPATLP